MPPPFMPPHGHNFNANVPRGPPIHVFNMLSRRQDSDITLVWVGKIAAGISDDSMRSILSQCGEITNWRRATDTKTGQPKSFGFCDFRFPEGAIIALHILLGLELGDSKLSLRVDEKTQRKLADTKRKVRASSQQDFEPDSILTKDEEAEIRKRVNVIVSPINKVYSNAFDDPDNVEDENLAKELRMIKARKEREEEDRKKKEEERRRDFEYKRQKIEEDKERQRRKEIEEEKIYHRKEREVEEDQMARERELERRERDDSRKIELRNRDMEEDDIDDKYRRRKIRATRRDRIREREQDIEDEEREREELRERERRVLEDERRKREYEERKQREMEEEAKRQKQMEEQMEKEEEEQEEAPKQQPQEELVIQLEPITKPSKPKAKVMVPNIFKTDAEDEDEVQLKQKKKLFIEPLLLEKEEEKKKEDQLLKAQKILETIPSEKEKLFAMEINWELVKSKDIINLKLRPYIDKKITEYIGEPDEDITDFICEQIESQTEPEAITEQLASIIEEDAPVFINRLWRLLIYEMKLQEE